MYKDIDKPIRLTDVVKLGSYDEVEGLDLVSITKNDADKGTKLDGLILRGYETKFSNGTNENGERYTKECLDAFIEKYYIKNKLNMPLTIQHRDDLMHIAGRVLTLEVNSVGFYFVCYIPKSHPEYERIKMLVKEGVLQGLSKEGWCTKGKCFFTKEGDFDYYEVQEIEMTAVSLVTTPANGQRLEKAQEVRNALTFIKENNANNDKPEADAFGEMFN